MRYDCGGAEDALDLLGGRIHGSVCDSWHAVS